MTGTDPMDELRAVLDEMTGYLIEANRRVPGGNKDWGRCIERAIALLGRADAAGARDETITALTKVAQIVVDCRDLPAGEFRDRWGVVTWADYYDKLTALADAALDALRDGGAG